MATYRELGERLGVDICTNCAMSRHDVGFWSDGKFHWAERALRRTSIRNFVWRLAAQEAARPIEPAPSWIRYWYRVRWAKDALKTLRVRLPADAWDQQRATLRALLAVPDARDFFSDVFSESRGAARKAAIRWSKKPVDPGARADYDA